MAETNAAPSPVNLTGVTPDSPSDWLSIADQLFGHEPQEGVAFARLGMSRMMLHGGRAHVRDLLSETRRLRTALMEARKFTEACDCITAESGPQESARIRALIDAALSNG